MKKTNPFDLEKENFVGWIAQATPEELAIARKNNPAKLAELKTKYQFEIKLTEIFRGLAETRREMWNRRHPITGRP